MPDNAPKWTAGPWSAYNRGIGWEVHGPFGGPINDGFRDTFTDADAHLIAAAPDLYQALEALTHPKDDKPACEVFAMARAALAKARGESE
jgi:hypothetical protein